MKPKPYDPKKIEKKWQNFWAKKGTYKTSDTKGDKKCYVLDMFPYPSGDGLHVGHPKGYIATDVYSRFKKMNGYSVLHPMGWDAFGLPAENYAIKNKVHPRKAVEKNIQRFKEQLSKIGFNYDWSREVNTTDPEYYRWTQWIFLKLFDAGLAYESYEPINWCPSCQTGLANEDLEDGRCERCGSVVEKKPIRQWVLRITNYADRLLSDLDLLSWPESIKESQRQWIGRSEGAEIEFKIKDQPHSITVFTTRPDTLFGATYMVLAPEHSLLQHLKGEIKNWEEVEAYIRTSGTLSDIERTSETKEKTGVELRGIKVINPANDEEIPVWVADYVLGHYGTGAIMAVPAHDLRDNAFARVHHLPIREVIEPQYTQTTEPGVVKPGVQFVERDSIIAIVKHWSEEKYLGLKWKTVAWGTWITGGIEEGQTAEEAARAEIAQETGYRNLRLIEDLGLVHGTFYHVPKQVNRLVHGRCLYFELTDSEKADVAEEEKALHDVVWLSKEEVEKFLTADTHKWAWRQQQKIQEPFTGEGVVINSGDFSGMTSAGAEWSITQAVGGKRVSKYKLRDWVFARQRYWGEPFPLIYCTHCAEKIKTNGYKKGEYSKGELLNPGWVKVPEKDLPVELPDVKSYEPTGTGESPLAHIEKWVTVLCPHCKGLAKRETNTMPQWAGSSWYYLRFIDPKNKKALVDPKKEKYWSPVDVYVGGTEHATRHLIYARFWHKFLYDIKAVSRKEPFMRLQSLGVVLAEDGRKMSKRWGNVINPDDIISSYGADTMRLYEMFMGPFENAIAWNTESMVGVRRFLERVWRMKEKVQKTGATVSPELDTLLHKTIKKVGEDIEGFKFNTAISSLMILTNELEKMESISLDVYRTLIQLVAPFAPHMAEEVWETLKGKGSVHLSVWPAYDSKKLISATATLAIQINGKTRDTMVVEGEISEADAVRLAQEREAVKKWTEGKQIKKVIYVPGRILNLVIV